MGRVIELIMEYAPQPPYGTGRPDLADAQILAAARVALQHAISGASDDIQLSGWASSDV
jgi:hypothetical protein